MPWPLAEPSATRLPTSGAIAPAVKTSFPTITDPSKIAELLRAIDGYKGSFITQCALKGPAGVCTPR
jgi:hypothetical protein